MSEQTAIPTPPEAAVSGPCAWCGATPTTPIEVERARFGRDPLTGVRVLKRHAIVVPACVIHTGIIERQAL